MKSARCARSKVSSRSTRPIAQPRPPQAPATPCAPQRGWRGPAAASGELPTSPPLRALEHALAMRTSAAQPARQANACHAGCFRSPHIERPTASRPRAPDAKPTPAEPPTPPDRCVLARLRCSSRASLPLTPRLARLLQQLECALPLRSGQRQSQ